MATESTFASLDGTVIHGEASAAEQQPGAIARRSASIFSRRGNNTPKLPFIAQVAITRAPTQMTDKQRRWSRRKSAPADSAPKPRGTILNVVPPAKTIKMTPLEEEMATSPNEEILSAISGSPTTPASFEWPTPTKEQMDGLWNQTRAPLAQRTQSVYRKERSSRIGVWRKGVAHWDDAVHQEGPWWTAPSPQTATGFTPLRRIPTERLNIIHSRKPTLSVIIPSEDTLLNDNDISSFIESKTDLPTVTVAPPSAISTALENSIQQSQQLILPAMNSVRPPLSKFQKWRHTNLGGSCSPHTPRPSQHSSTSSYDSIEEDGDSIYSRKSSVTSIGSPAAEITPEKIGHHPDEVACKTSHAPESQALNTMALHTDKPLPPPPMSPPTRSAPRVPEPTDDAERVQPFNVKTVFGPKSTGDLRTTRRKTSSQSLKQLDALDQEFMQSAPDLRYGSFPYTPNLSTYPSTPTLSEAEEDLELQINNLSTPSSVSRAESIREVEDIQYDHFSYIGSGSEAKPTDADSDAVKPKSIGRNGSVRSVMHPPERAPTIPKRSRKREWRVSRKLDRAAQLSLRTARRRKSDSQLNVPNTEHDPMPLLKRTPSATELSLVSDVAKLHKTPIESLRPPVPRIVVDEGLVVLNGPVKVLGTARADVSVSYSAAEDVLLLILATLDNTTDLINTAVINKGMYRVFKENEMDLFQTVMSNQSPAAWEFLEWRTPGEANDTSSSNSSLQLQWTPKSYMAAHRQAMAVIENIKKLILERCQTVIRRETAFALSSPNNPHAKRFDDAFWRIWSFCTIFGNGKGREEDVTGQLDWLKGGILATNQDLTATMNMNLDYDMISVLLNPPEYFAKGNEGGLSSQQLYDMIEIFTCMKTLLEGYHYRTEQAWVHGLFANSGVKASDAETEAELLEEWTSYLLSLGPEVVLTMAEYAHGDGECGFAQASTNGWTDWHSPDNTTWRDFFKPVSRLYEERVAANALKWQNPCEQEKKESSRRRVATLAQEIKLARSASSFRSRPVIDMSLERSMSGVSRQASTASGNPRLTTRMSQGPVSPLTPQTATFPPPTTKPIPATNRKPQPPPLPPRNSRAATPPTSSTNLWSPRTISPIIEDRVETFNLLSLRNYGTGVAEGTVERAVQKITDMGFSLEQARRALVLTDSGGGLRVDLAMEWLLKEGL